AGGGAAGGGAAGGGASCDGGFRVVSVANVTGGTIFEAVGYGNADAVWLGGHSNASELRVLTDAGFVERAGPPCGGRVFSGWARSDGVFYVAGDGFGLKGLVPGTADCNALAPSAFTAYGMDGLSLNPSTTLLALVGREFQGPQPKGARAQLIESTFLAGNPKEVTADVSSLADELWDVAVQPGASKRFFAVGMLSGQEQLLSSLPDAGWQKASGFNSRPGVLSAVAFRSATEGYAAGSATLYRFDGTNWNAQVGALPFEVFGLAVVGPSDVYAVGAGEGIARWNGSWQVLRAPSGSAYLNRIRGPSACELFTSGSGGTYTSRP
ncbi:MAG: hypothetical protein K1X89_30110, partial [Myxococcaceae bacterium]|nr:hypothetical protein [Myxococcaceae bacterium]